MALAVSAEIEARLLASSGEAPVWTNGELYRDNEGLARSNDRLKEEKMLWVQRMNSIRDRAMEIVNHDLIYA